MTISEKTTTTFTATSLPGAPPRQEVRPRRGSMNNQHTNHNEQEQSNAE